MIRAFLEKRRIRRVFEKLVDPEHGKKVLRDGLGRPRLSRARIEFVVAFVRGDNPAQVAERIGRVTDVAITQNAIVHELIGALVITAFGTRSGSQPESDCRVSLVRALQQELAGDIKIVHGAADGHYGLFGSERRMSYSFLVPEFDRVLGNLSRLGFGESEEFT